MSVSDQEALQHCELGLQEMWRGDAVAALAQYERAAAVAVDDETQELLTIRKAEALIALDRQGPEIAALPGIVMRHRSARHVYLAANTLQRHLCESDQRPRAIFYGGIARRAADELGDPMARVSVLNHLGVTLVADSQFGAALEALDEAMINLSMLDHSREEIRALRASVDVCRGGALVLR